MEKKKSHAFGKNIYFLGRDVYGENCWLEEASWDCNWYWGFGYVETYTNNKNPSRSKDISVHQHFDELFFRTGKTSFDAFNDFFAETPLTDKEIWRLLELMKSFYIAKEYASMIYLGGAHYTSHNPCEDIIKDSGEWERISRVVIPAICEEVYKLLGGEA